MKVAALIRLKNARKRRKKELGGTPKKVSMRICLFPSSCENPMNVNCKLREKEGIERSESGLLNFSSKSHRVICDLNSAKSTLTGCSISCSLCLESTTSLHDRPRKVKDDSPEKGETFFTSSSSLNFRPHPLLCQSSVMTMRAGSVRPPCREVCVHFGPLSERHCRPLKGRRKSG